MMYHIDILQWLIILLHLHLLSFLVPSSSSTVRKHYDNFKHNDNNNNDNNNYCPASSLIKFHVDGYFNYPIDLFYPKYFSYLKQLLNTTTTSINNYDNSNNYDDNDIMKNLYKLTLKKSIITHDNDNIVVYNCSKPNFDEDLKFYPYHLCLINSNHRLLDCPLTIDNIIDATLFINNIDNYHHNTSGYDNYDNEININNRTKTASITTTNSSSNNRSSNSNISSTSKHQHHQNLLHVSKS